MSRANVENLTERERACLEHLRQAQELGLSFAEYCRQRVSGISSPSLR